MVAKRRSLKKVEGKGGNEGRRRNYRTGDLTEKSKRHRQVRGLPRTWANNQGGAWWPSLGSGGKNRNPKSHSPLRVEGSSYALGK